MVQAQIQILLRCLPAAVAVLHYIYSVPVAAHMVRSTLPDFDYGGAVCGVLLHITLWGGDLHFVVAVHDMLSSCSHLLDALACGSRSIP